MGETRRALILTDGKAGHENQSKAFARALGCESDLLKVSFSSKHAKAASYLLDWFGVRAPNLLVTVGENGEQLPLGDRVASLRGMRYAAVIGTGSGTFYAAKALAKRLETTCGVVLYPRGYRMSTFDCVLAPSFDRPAKAANVIELPANLVANDESFYEKGVKAFEEHYLKATGRPVDPHVDAVAVIVGGPNKCSTMKPEWVKARLETLFGQKGNREYWVTTSRRTPRDVESVVDSFPFEYKLLYSRDRFNPIPAFVKRAKRLYVTAESTGMLSEACTFGSARVFVLDNLNPGRHKFRRFVENLAHDGYVDGNRKVDLSGQFASARRLMGL